VAVVLGRREEALDAAIRVLGSEGSRGLTHRRVDREAGWPAGSTSNYFRSRDALITGIVARMEELDYQDWAQQTRRDPVHSLPELLEVLTQLVVLAATVGRVRTQARYALFVEAAVAGGQSPIVQSIRRSRSNLVAWGTSIFSGLDQPVPDGAAELLVDYLDGVILHQLTGTVGPVDPDAVRSGVARFLSLLTAAR
jgi:DNA-binding transcriptional regulator YbjK